MATKYVIRKQVFLYTDEGFMVQDEPENFQLGSFYQVFDDEKIAKEMYRNLIIASLRHPSLKIHYFEGEFISEFQQFVWGKLGDQSYDPYDTEGLPPNTLSDDDLLEFAHCAGWLPYVLCSFEDTESLYAVWMVLSEEYLISSVVDREWDYYLVLVGDNSRDLTQKALYAQEYDALYNALKYTLKNLRLMGTPEELSDQPELFKRFLALPDTGFFYDVLGQFIEIRVEYPSKLPELFQQYLHTFNSLLKKPLYELHPIHPEQIMQVFENPTVRIA